MLHTLPFDTIKAAYKQTEHSTWNIRTKRHWLTLRSGRGEFVLRLDKNNYEEILGDLEERSSRSLGRSRRSRSRSKSVFKFT